MSDISIWDECICTSCGWPVLVACCNGEFEDFVSSKGEYPCDWYIYCPNKGCKNHEGEPMYKEGQGIMPKWVDNKR